GKQFVARMERFGRDGQQLVDGWRTRDRLPLIARYEKTLEWIRQQRQIPARVRATAEALLTSRLEEACDVVTDWIDMLGDPEALRGALERLVPGVFSAMEIGTITRWCAQKAAALNNYVDYAEAAHEAKVAGESDPEVVEDRVTAPALDGEDDAIFLRLLQAKYGGIFVGRRRYELEHIVIDEAQDLCPLEVRVLLDCSSAGRSITVAGDKAQKMIFDNGFVSWSQLLSDAGLPHVEIQPLKITYRSTREVMRLAQEVLGDLRDEDAPIVARSGAPVGYYDFGDQGESVAFLGEALRNLMIREPSASVAVICRYPQQAKMYYDGLHLAEVPRVRLVARQDFSFKPGIDVTDVRQVKGLEFDYVVLMDPTEQNYPSVDSSRHLLHIAATRTAYQLWIVCTGIASKLLPQEMIDAGTFGSSGDV
ncbi:MAG: 3'-5' exonuclease, partial [Nannocystaceae bacterium]